LQNRLQRLFQKWIDVSLQRGLIDPTALDLSGDGSCLDTGASEQGKPACSCRANKVFKCQCPRYYSDRTAQWGYDAYRERHFFGHRFYQLTASASGHDLPLALTIAPGNHSDYTLSLETLDRWLKQAPGLRPKTLILDAGHDSHAHYAYLAPKEILAVIALNERTRLETPDKTLSKRGIPVCEAGLEMTFHHRDTQRRRQYFHCPAKRKARVKGKLEFVAEPQRCPLGVLCQPETVMGPVVYLNEAEDLRLSPIIRRNSTEYRKLMNLRSGCERSNATKKSVYKIEQTRFKRASRFLIALYLIAMLEHASAWLKQDLSAQQLTARQKIEACFHAA
jgi:hypothetical protein